MDTDQTSGTEGQGFAEKSAAERQELAREWVKIQAPISAYIGSFVEDMHATQDLVQEVAEAVAVKFHEYDRTRPFLTWALAIARNKVMRYYRDKSKDRHLFSTDMMDAVTSAFERAAPLAEARRDAIRTCISSIEGRSQKVLKMRYFSDLKPNEIAGEIGLTSQAVRSLLTRIRKAIASCVRKRLTYCGDER